MVTDIIYSVFSYEILPISVGILVADSSIQWKCDFFHFPNPPKKM